MLIVRHQHWKFIALLAATTLLVAIGILNLLIAAPESIALELCLLLIGVVYLATGLFVLIKQTRAAPNYHFFAWSLASFVFYFYISSAETSQLGRLASFLDGASLALLAPLFLHFCARFLPRGRLVNSLGLAAALYVPALEFVLLELLFYARPSIFGASLVQVRGWLDGVERLQYALFLILGITLLVRSFLREKSPVLRQQRRFIVWGLSLSAISFAAFYTIRGLSVREVSPLLEALTYSPLVLIPLSFGYSMTGQRLMDVDLLVRRSFVRGAAAFAVIAIYALLLSSVGAIIARNAAELASWEGQAATILGMVAMAVLFPPLKNRFQMWADRWYYGDRRRLRTDLHVFGRELAQVTALPELLDMAAERVSRMFCVNQVATFIRDANAPLGFKVAHASGIDDDITVPENLEEVLREDSFGRGYVTAYDLDRNSGSNPGIDGMSEITSPEGLQYYVPCVVNEQIVAIIGVSRTTSAAPLTSEDLDLLKELSEYVAIPISNSLTYEHLNESIVENASIGILVIDERGRITRWNREMGEVFGASPGQALGHSIYEVINGGLVQSIEAAIAQPIWRISGVRHIYKHKIVTKGEPPLIVNISLAPIENGSTRGTMMMIQNITDFVHLEQELRKDNGLRTIDGPRGEARPSDSERLLAPDQQSSTAPRREEPNFFQKYSPRRGS